MVRGDRVVKQKMLDNPEKYAPYKHMCGCMDGAQYLWELPFDYSCVDAVFLRRMEDNEWVDVTHKVYDNSYSWMYND